MDTIHLALEKVRSGKMSNRKVEIVYDIATKTLNRHLSGQVSKPGHLGRYERILGDDLENVLSQRIIQMQLTMFAVFGLQQVTNISLHTT